VRLLDPPMHEFLPSEQQLLDEIAALHEYRVAVKGQTTALQALGVPIPEDAPSEDLVNSVIAKKQQMLRKVRELYEVNPMLGHRGVRLGLTYPDIYEMQIRAILEATALCLQDGIQVRPEIMVPQVITARELVRVKQSVEALQHQIETQCRRKLVFKFGSMIETVRACTRADTLAEVAEFFSFGTNDLTQATFSFSREDAENKFLPLYIASQVLQENPFEVLDVDGMGTLMQMAVEKGRHTNPTLKVGICGEHGGHPASIQFCHHIGLNYVSCSAPRVPVARLAAAHATLLENK
jgi:pyruvate,orthophosphate dikinase